MRHQLRNLTVAAGITATMLLSGAADRAAAEAPGEGASLLCYPPVVDPTSGQYTQLSIPEIPSATTGPPRQTCQNGAPPDCYLLIVDPDSRRYVELQIPDVPGVVFGPPRPTCHTPAQMVMPQ